jgi:5'-methylthioadenosine phosphorylase
VAEVVRVLDDNAANAQALVSEVAHRTAPRTHPCPHGCDRVLDTAIITPRHLWPEDSRIRLATVAPRILAET